MNREALRLTAERGEAVYWSRSPGRLPFLPFQKTMIQIHGLPSANPVATVGIQDLLASASGSPLGNPALGTAGA